MRRFPFLCAVVVLVTACRPGGARGPEPRVDPTPIDVVPAPAYVRVLPDSFTLDSTSSIAVDATASEAARTADLLAAILRPSTGFALPVVEGSPPEGRGYIAFRIDESRDALGDEGYEILVRHDSIRITSRRPAGLFFGAQTLRQLFAPAIESHMRLGGRKWLVRAATITDAPRFRWRGAMLDVSRHFFTVDEVKQYIDVLALYKLNVFHMHLSDDQGWRIEIKSRPELTIAGSASEVAGGSGGFYTQEQFADIVRYAGERYITIVPEIDMPGHTNAALVAFPQLSCSRTPPAPYTGTQVGFSAFCTDNDSTYALIDDVVREIAGMTPGAYFHMGGDEVEVLTHEQYESFLQRVQDIVAKHGKIPVGWEEIGRTRLRPGTIVQNWRTDSAGPATLQGAKIVASPATRTYIDMKYNANTELGLRWAGLLDVRHVYDWDPAAYMKGATERDIIGVEAPLWAETIRNITAAQFLAVPRLPALAEVGWTPQSVRSWESFRRRLAAQGPRWRLLGINFYESPQIPW